MTHTFAAERHFAIRCIVTQLVMEEEERRKKSSKNVITFYSNNIVLEAIFLDVYIYGEEKIKQNSSYSRQYLLLISTDLKFSHAPK